MQTPRPTHCCQNSEFLCDGCHTSFEPSPGWVIRHDAIAQGKDGVLSAHGKMAPKVSACILNFDAIPCDCFSPFCCCAPSYRFLCVNSDVDCIGETLKVVDDLTNLVRLRGCPFPIVHKRQDLTRLAHLCKVGMEVNVDEHHGYYTEGISLRKSRHPSYGCGCLSLDDESPL